jgi:hypothetical protein
VTAAPCRWQFELHPDHISSIILSGYCANLYLSDVLESVANYRHVANLFATKYYRDQIKKDGWNKWQKWGDGD